MDQAETARKIKTIRITLTTKIRSLTNKIMINDK